MKSVLFICVNNAALSQMAEALFRDLCAGVFECHSAGLHPSPLDLTAVKVMSELQIDITHQRSKSVEEYVQSDKEFAYVVKLCGQVHGLRCPTIPRSDNQLEWSFPDPSTVPEVRGRKLQTMREVRDAMKLMLASWCVEVCSDRVA